MKEVICNDHSKCQFNSICEHAKPHQIKFQCHVKNNQIEKMNVSSCHCGNITLKQYRLQKLKKLNDTF